MYHIAKVKLADINQHFICGLCFGYVVDATTIIECLHSFCRSCLVRYLSSENCCPLCGQLVHKTKPLDYIRPDKALQDLAYKLVPHLYKDEMRRRREFYSEHQEAVPLTEGGEECGEEDGAHSLNLSDSLEKISVCLQIAGLLNLPADDDVKIKPNDKRYLLCPAYLNIGQLKKFLRMKFDLSVKHNIAMFLIDEDIPDHFTLTDIAVLYGWTRTSPLKIFYMVFNPGTYEDTSGDTASRVRKRSLEKHKRHNARHSTEHQSPQNEALAWEQSAANEHRPGSIPSAPLLTQDSVSSGIASSSDNENQLLLSPLLTTSNTSCGTVEMTHRSVSRKGSLSRSSFSIMRLLSLPDEDEEVESCGLNVTEDSRCHSVEMPLTTGPVSVDAADSHNAAVSYNGYLDQNCEPLINGAPMNNLATAETPILAGGTNCDYTAVNAAVHFKKRMISSSATTSAMPTVIGRRSPSSTPRSGIFTIHEDRQPLTVPSCAAATSTTRSSPMPPAKIGIIISHGRAMTLQDKLQMGSAAMLGTVAMTTNSTGASSAAVHRKAATGSRSAGRLKRKSLLARQSAKRSLQMTQAATPTSEDENASSVRLPFGDSSKRQCRKATKRSELALLLELDGGLLAASAEFRKANALRPRDNVSTPPHHPQHHQVSSTADLRTIQSVASATAASATSEVNDLLNVLHHSADKGLDRRSSSFEASNSAAMEAAQPVYTDSRPWDDVIMETC
jgi:hypothetical protein